MLFAFNNNTLFVGGEFATLSNYLTPALGLALFDGSTWSSVPPRSYGNGVSGTVNAAALFNGQLIVGGTFSSVGNNIPANNIAIYNRSMSAWSALSFQSSNGVLGGTVNALALFRGRLVAAGSFTALGDGFPAPYIVEWDGSELVPLSYGGNATIPPEAIRPDGSDSRTIKRPRLLRRQAVRRRFLLHSRWRRVEARDTGVVGTA
jgi:trimeric autotransporter adhesin